MGTNSVDLIPNFVEHHLGIISLQSSSSLLSSSTSSLSSPLTSSSSTSSSPTKHHLCDLHVFPRQIQLIDVDPQNVRLPNCNWVYYDFELTRIKYTCKFREININSHVLPRPGFVRLNLPYFMSDDSVEFVIKAVKMVAEHGWKLLPQVIKYLCKRSVFSGKGLGLSSGSLVVGRTKRKLANS